MDAAPRLFCFGYGYTVRALAASRAAAGWRIAGTGRGDATLDRLRVDGAAAFRFDDGGPLEDPAAALAGSTHLIAGARPGPAGDPVVAARGADLRAVPTLRWIGYLSSTAVYGDRGGQWVDEDTPIAPESRRGKARAAAEQAWLALGRAAGVPVQVFRLAGIYGPGRSQLDTLRAGTARRIVKPGQVMGRIHVDDIVAVLEASMARPQPGRVYNVTDDEPAPTPDVVACAAELLGLPAPPEQPYETADLSPMAAAFYAECRRVRNERIKRELGVRLRHPDYRSGLAALVAGGH